MERLLTPAFKAWFGDSKVVDAEGRPKIMYHGSSSGEIEAFNSELASPTALYGPGFYFTDSPEIAGSDGGAKTAEELEAKAAFNLAGYAFQGAKYDAPPLTKRQMAHAKRLLWGQEVARDAYNDIGARNAAVAGQRAFLAGEPEFRRWLTNGGARWMRERLKVEREQSTRPTVYPVHLAIEHPFEADAAMPENDRDRMVFGAVSDAGKANRILDGLKQARLYSRNAITGTQVYNAIAAEIGKPATKAALQKMGFDGIHHQGGKVIGTMGVRSCHGNHVLSWTNPARCFEFSGAPGGRTVPSQADENQGGLL